MGAKLFPRNHRPSGLFRHRAGYRLNSVVNGGIGSLVADSAVGDFAGKQVLAATESTSVTCHIRLPFNLDRGDNIMFSLYMTGMALTHTISAAIINDSSCAYLYIATGNVQGIRHTGNLQKNFYLDGNKNLVFSFTTANSLYHTSFNMDFVYGQVVTNYNIEFNQDEVDIIIKPTSLGNHTFPKLV